MSFVKIRAVELGLKVEAAVVAAVTAAVVGTYAVTRPPFFNPPWTIDPWLYTALWVNFKQIYHRFWGTYYAARLPWIIPGYALNAIFSPRSTYFILHGAFFFAGGLAAYLLFRAHFGRTAATIGFVWLLGSQMYFDSHRWDYWDGALSTFILLALYFGIPASSSRQQVWRLVLAGFFIAAAVATNIFAIVLAIGLPILYGATRFRRPVGQFLRAALRDAGWAALGVALLMGPCAAFARKNGGPTWFIGPQIKAAKAIKSSDFKVPYHVWLPQSPRVIVPAFLALAGVLALWAIRHRSATFRAGLGALAYLVVAVGVLGVWEITGGALLEYVYYFSPLLPAMALCVAFIASAAIAATPRAERAVAVVLCASATLGPLFYLYRDDRGDRFGRAAYLPAGILMALALIALVFGLFGGRARATAVAAAAGIVLATAASAYALDASTDVFSLGDSSSISGPVFDLGMDEIKYIHQTIPGDALPAFWYDQHAAGGILVGIQSLYYYGYTAIAFDLPKWNSSVSGRYEDLASRALVLLCETRACAGAPTVLRRHEHGVVLRSARRFAADGEHMWIQIFVPH